VHTILTGGPAVLDTAKAPKTVIDQFTPSIAADLGIGVASVYRILAEARVAGPPTEALSRNSVYWRRVRHAQAIGQAGGTAGGDRLL
jgi:hypothetical protein